MEIRSRTTGASRNDRIATTVIRGMFVIGSVGLLVAVSLRGQWEARLRTTDAGTFISHLPTTPVWQPPAVPAYHHFTEIFDNLPAEQPNSSIIAIVTRWDWMALEVLLWFWLLASFIGVLYIMARGACVDTLLHFVLHLAIGLTLGAIACVGLWLMFGGWGPPAPLFFGTCGLILGIVLGVARLRQVNAAPTGAPGHATEQRDEREPE